MTSAKHHIRDHAWWHCSACDAPRPVKLTVGWSINPGERTCRCPTCDDAHWESIGRGPVPFLEDRPE